MKRDAAPRLTGAAALQAKNERRAAHLQHLQNIQAAIQPQAGQQPTQYRTPTQPQPTQQTQQTPPGKHVQAPTPGAAGSPTKSAKQRQKNKERVIRQFQAAQTTNTPKTAVGGAVVAVPDDGKKTVTFDAVQGAVVGADRITESMWKQVTAIGDFVKRVNAMKDESPTYAPNPTASRRPPDRWLQDTGARYDLIGRNELPQRPRCILDGRSDG